MTAAENAELIEIDLIEIDVTIDMRSRPSRTAHAYSVTVKAPAASRRGSGSIRGHGRKPSPARHPALHGPR